MQYQTRFLSTDVTVVCSLPRVDFAGGRKEQEGGRKEGSSALPAGGGSTGSAPKGQQEIQVSKLVNW